MENVVVKHRIEPGKYVNMETGELMDDEFGDVSYVGVRDGRSVVRYGSFVAIDSRALMRLSGMFSDVELGRIIKICDLVQTEWSVVCKAGTREPHTKASLMAALGISRNTFEPFYKRMLALGVLYLLTGKKKGRKKIVDRIILNPTIGRKRKVFHSQCVAFFEDFRKPIKGGEMEKFDGEKV